jgi:hypothetical protein
MIAPGMLATAASLSQQIGLLSNDGLIVAVMQANGLTRLASSDVDFDRWYNGGRSGEPSMTTITIRSEITSDGTLRIEVPCELPPGPVEVVMTVQPQHGAPRSVANWDEVYGLGREVWQGVDSQQYVRDLRQDREFAK